MFALTATVLLVFVVDMLLRSGQFRISRSATMAAPLVPPEAVFAHVNDLHRWNA